MITCNLPFSKWEGIFKDPMTTAATIDRLVHHSVILEMNVPRYRLEQAEREQKTENEQPVAEPSQTGDSDPLADAPRSAQTKRNGGEMRLEL